MLEIKKEVFPVVLFAKFFFFGHFQMQKLVSFICDGSVISFQIARLSHIICKDSSYIGDGEMACEGSAQIWNPKGECILWNLHVCLVRYIGFRCVQLSQEISGKEM